MTLAERDAAIRAATAECEGSPGVTHIDYIRGLAKYKKDVEALLGVQVASFYRHLFHLICEIVADLFKSWRIMIFIGSKQTGELR
jgi:hypothetical protein